MQIIAPEIERYLAGLDRSTPLLETVAAEDGRRFVLAQNRNLLHVSLPLGSSDRRALTHVPGSARLDRLEFSRLTRITAPGSTE